MSDHSHPVDVLPLPSEGEQARDRRMDRAGPTESRRTIVCLASNYFFDPTSKHHVMRELSKSHHVLWINWHASRKPQLNRRDIGSILDKLRQVGGGVVHVSDRLWVMTPLVLPFPSSRLARKLNRWLVGLQTRWVLRRLPRGRELWSFTPDVTELLGAFGERHRVYYCVDEFSAFPGYDRKSICELDREMCERADIVLASSRGLYESKKPYNPRTHYGPHGVLHSHFARAVASDFPEAEDLCDIPRPRVGYYGLVHEWQDLSLMAELARRRPEWSFVFVGKVQTDVESYAARNNMHFLGQRPHESLPHYSRGFDVAVIPHKVNNLTRNMNPIKLREYLAAGLPVVSSPLPEVEAYAPHVRTASTCDEWERNLDEAIHDRSVEADRERCKRVAEESWSARVREIEGLVSSARRRGKTVAE